jgi:hypothetical protein
VGYNDEGAIIRWCCADLEAAEREDAAVYLPEPEADKRLTDVLKIAADIAKKRAVARERLPLDPNGCRIVALGFQSEYMDGPTVCAADFQSEKEMLQYFWSEARGRRLVGFCSRRYDLPVLIQRSRMLGVAIPDWRNLIAPYGRSRGHVDLYDEWTLDGTIKGEIPNNLLTVCALNGIAIPDDDSKGKDMAALVAAGDYAAIRQHCSRDVERTVALARALKVIPAAVEAPVF